MDVTRIVAIRHGETSWNSVGRLQGHTDIELNAHGLWQAQQMAQVLAERDLDAIHSSDLKRALQTAQALAQTTGLPLEVSDQWRERSFGSFEGQSFADIEASDPESARRWRAREPDFSAPGGESLRQFHARVLAQLNTIAARSAGQHIAIVTHGGVLDVLYRHANGLALDAPRSWRIENASINRFLWSPESFSMVGWADNAHLDTACAQDEKFV